MAATMGGRHHGWPLWVAATSIGRRRGVGRTGVQLEMQGDRISPLYILAFACVTETAGNGPGALVCQGVVAARPLLGILSSLTLIMKLFAAWCTYNASPGMGLKRSCISHPTAWFLFVPLCPFAPRP